MTSVSGNAASNLGDANVQDSFATSFQESLADVLNAIRGTKLTANDLKFEQPNERQIYFAIVLSKLKQENPPLAAELLREAPAIRKALLEKGDRNGLTHAIDKIISSAIKRGKYTKAQYADLKRFALSRAQVDANRADLTGSRARSVNRYDERASQTNIEAVTAKVTAEAQRDASDRDLRIFNRVLKAAPRYRYKPSEGTSTTSAAPEPPAAPETPKVPMPQGPSETDKPQSPPDPMKQYTAPNDFVFKPRSERDGFMLVQVPLEFAPEVHEVEIVSQQSGEVLRNLRYSGVGDDGRSYFRGDEPGDALERMVYVRMRFRNGEVLGYAVDDTTQFFKF